MTTDAMAWAVAQPVADPTARDVLLALAARQRPGAPVDAPIRVSMGDLSRHLELGPLALYAALRRLLTAGLIRTGAITEFMTIELALSCGVSGREQEEVAE